METLQDYMDYLISQGYNRYSFDAIGRVIDALEDCKMYGRKFPKDIDWTNIPEKEVEDIKKRYGIQ